MFTLRHIDSIHIRYRNGHSFTHLNVTKIALDHNLCYIDYISNDTKQLKIIPIRNITDIDVELEKE